MTDTIVLASNNAGKLKEFNALFAERNIRILPQSQFVQEECAEPYQTFVENALAKARFGRRTGRVVGAVCRRSSEIGCGQ